MFSHFHYMQITIYLGNLICDQDELHCGRRDKSQRVGCGESLWCSEGCSDEAKVQSGLSTGAPRFEGSGPVAVKSCAQAFRQAFALAIIRLWSCAEAFDAWRAKINVSPHLCGFVKHVQVLPCGFWYWFSSQGPAIFVQKFRFPQQLVDFSLEKSELEQSFHQIMPEQPATIEPWGESFEQVVGACICFKGTPHNIFQLLTRDDVSNPNN